MRTSVRIRWRSYETGVWHAWVPGANCSLCRSVSLRRGRHGPPTSQPGGHPCRTCASRARDGRLPEPTISCTGRGGCPCRDCRRERRQLAHRFSRSVDRSLPVCGCVRSWRRAGPVVGEAETRVLALLLVWEMTESLAVARDLEDAVRELKGRWFDAAAEYELADGSHPEEVHR